MKVELDRAEMLDRLATEWADDPESFEGEGDYLDLRHLVLTGQAIYTDGGELLICSIH